MKNRELTLFILKVLAVIILFFVFHYVFKYTNEKSQMFIFTPKIIATAIFGILFGLIISIENIINIIRCDKYLVKFSWLNFTVCIFLLISIFYSPVNLFFFRYVFGSVSVFLLNSILLGHFISKIIKLEKNLT